MTTRHIETHYPGETKDVTVSVTGDAALGTQPVTIVFDHGPTATATWIGSDVNVGGVHTRPCKFTLNNALRPTGTASRFQGVYTVVVDGVKTFEDRAGAIAFLG